jgi:hypothetical protein
LLVLPAFFGVKPPAFFYRRSALTPGCRFVSIFKGGSGLNARAVQRIANAGTRQFLKRKLPFSVARRFGNAS